MQIVINVSEEDYNFVKRQIKDGITNPLKICIANGTPLPTGHGRLIDADALKISEDYDGIDAMNAIYSASTLVEADKTGRK